MITKEIKVNVVAAAERRIVDIFEKNKKVQMSFSGGKDSICLADMMIKTMQKFNISFSRLVVVFIDEEAIYPDVEKIVLQWRSKFLSLGASFLWFCLPVKHYNCCNRLANDESFICWDPAKQSVWIRPMPKFAIRYHDKFKQGDSYQTFLKRIFYKIPQVVGLRISESIQRRISIARRNEQNDNAFCYPIYDWRDNDIWLYIQRNNIEYPATYIYLYKVGVSLKRLRISQFFSIDTIKSLPKVLEFYPDLFMRVLNREPNADLVMLYYDTDMFRSSKQNNQFRTNKDYKALFIAEIAKAASAPDTYPGYKLAKRLYALMVDSTPAKVWQDAYQILVAGDPKRRTYRRTIGAVRSDVT